MTTFQKQIALWQSIVVAVILKLIFSMGILVNYYLLLYIFLTNISFE